MNLIIKKYIRFENIKQLVNVAIILGFIFGIGKGLLFIYSNRYFELGMNNIAFSYFRSIVNYFSLISPFIFLIVFLTIFFIYFILTVFLKDTVKSEKYIYYTVITIILFTILLRLFLITGYRLNKLPWYPVFFSVEGFIYNTTVTLFFIFLGFVIFKTLPRIHEFLSSIVPRIFHLAPKVFHFRFALITLFLLLVLNSFFYYHQLQRDRNGLNVLFITIDTLRADHLGSYGYLRDASPNIDKLAKEGILFSQAIVQWPKTTPSFASMLTSTYGYYNGVIRHSGKQKISNYFILLPEILRNANYNTVGVVTNPVIGAAANFNQGFDTYIQVWRKFESQHAEYVTEHALSWLRDNSHKGKFFMWLHYVDPHAPYNPPEPYNEMYVGDKYYNGSRRAKLNPGRSQNIGGIHPQAHLGDHDEIDYYIAQYDAEIRYMDENIGKVLDTVKAMGLIDNTIIIFTADHGESLGDHNYYFAHGLFPYDDCVRVPLIIKIPGLKSEIKVMDKPVELINIMPTVLDILKIPVNKEAQGKSLVPFMLRDGDSIPEYAFTESGYQLNYQRMIRTKKWKLIYIPDKEDQKIMQRMPFELYDIENDPNELNNLINVETKIAGELQKELFKWMESAKGIDGLPSSPEQLSVDKETEEVLRSLGYVE